MANTHSETNIIWTDVSRHSPFYYSYVAHTHLLRFICREVKPDMLSNFGTYQK